MEQCVSIECLTRGDQSLLHEVQFRRFGRHVLYQLGNFVTRQRWNTVGQEQQVGVEVPLRCFTQDGYSSHLLSRDVTGGRIVYQSASHKRHRAGVLSLLLRATKGDLAMFREMVCPF